LRLEGADRYNPERLNDLSRHVGQQISSGTYDLEACLALLRLYNFDPDTVNVSLLASVLLKALTQLPEVDFNLMLHLIPERFQDEPMIAAVIVLDGHLEGARFAQFWQQVEALRELVNPVVGFYDAVRAYIVHCLATTFQKVSKASLSQALRLDGTSLDSLIQSKVSKDGWIVGDDDIVKFNKGQVTKAAPQAAVADFRFEQLAPVLAISA